MGLFREYLRIGIGRKKKEKFYALFSSSNLLGTELRPVYITEFLYIPRFRQWKPRFFFLEVLRFKFR